MANTMFFGVGDEVVLSLLCGSVITVIVGIFSLWWHQSHLRDTETPESEERMSSLRPLRIFNTEQCPICLGPHRLPIETNCGHKFCGSCLKNCFDNRTPRNFSPFSGCLTCPMCRQEINLLLLNFSQTDYLSSVTASERNLIETMVHEYNIRYSGGPRTLWSYIRDCPVLFRHMITEFFSFGGLVWMFRVRVLVCFIAAIMYLFLPLDIIPETIFGFFGLLDDIIILFLCAIYVSIIYRRFVVNRGQSVNDADS